MSRIATINSGDQVVIRTGVFKGETAIVLEVNRKPGAILPLLVFCCGGETFTDQRQVVHADEWAA